MELGPQAAELEPVAEGQPRAPAKIAPPRLPNVYPRARLFRELDLARRHSVIWIAAPAGYGKTTLVASYLEERQLPTLWYQLDEGDSDPATFFHYLGLAARRTAPQLQSPLPAFTPEYFANVMVFARRAFETLAAGLPERTVLVFDNYQEVASESALHEVLHNSFSQIPATMNVVIISRNEPPAEFAPDRANSTIIILDRRELELTEQESEGICRVRAPHAVELAGDAIRQIHQSVQGWAAGFVLMLERLRSTKTFLPALPEAPSQVLFDYFCREVFDKTDPETQRLLLFTAYLPMVSARAAEVLTGDARAGVRLARLHHSNFFTVALSEPGRLYQYHPLLREFLLARSNQVSSKGDRDVLVQRSAELLEGEGRIEDAAQLLQSTDHWSSLAALLGRHASTLIERGSHRTVAGWLGKLPAELRDGEPWLRFWLGVSRLPFDETGARQHLSGAYADFRARGDAAGSFSAWAAAVQAIVFEWHDFAGLDRWIADFARLVEEFPEFPSPQIQAQVVSSMFAALMYCQPAHPEIEDWCERLVAVTAHIPDPSMRVMIGVQLVIYQGIWLGELAAMEDMLQLIRPARDAQLSAAAEVCWQACVAVASWLQDRVEEGQAAVAEACRIQDEQGIMLLSFVVNAAGANLHLCKGEVSNAAPYVRKLESLLGPRRKFERMYYLVYTSWMAMRRGDVPKALSAAEACVELSNSSQDVIGAYAELFLGQALHAAGQAPRAMDHAARTLWLGEQTRSPLLQYRGLLLQSLIELDSGHMQEGLQVLRKALSLGRKKGYARLNNYHDDERALAKLCVWALEANIEVDYVSQMIRGRGLLLPQGAPVPESWPLPITIYTLGRFSILRDGEAVKFKGKAQNKPLELLKALIALGGRDVREERLQDLLWPDADPSAAAYSLTSAVHRLRGLIGVEAVQRQSGRLSLDAKQCWVDVWAFERRMTALERAVQGADREETQRLTVLLRQQFNGNFLDSDGEQPWVLAMRRRLRERLRRLLLSSGTLLAGDGRYERARACYEHAIAVDPLSEDPYRSLMRLNLEQGRHSDVLSTYRTCREVLAAHLGCTPSLETEALVHQVKSN